MIPGAAVFLVLVALVVPGFFILMWGVGGYHRLVLLRNSYKSAYTQVEVQLKRRNDLILALVETAKGYLTREQGTLEAVVGAQNAAAAAQTRAALASGDPRAMNELSGAETALASTLGRLLALSEADPELNANHAMANLVKEFHSVEDQAELARRAYNDAVMSYNALRVMFPTNLIAGPLSFGPAEPFTLEKLSPF